MCYNRERAGWTAAGAGGDSSNASAPEESPGSTGQDAGQHPGGVTRRKCHRNQTANPIAPQWGVRVKRWGKSPPEAQVTGPAG